MLLTNDEMIYCRLFKKEIAVGLCADVEAVSGKMLKISAVPEVKDIPREEIEYACDHCQHCN